MTTFQEIFALEMFAPNLLMPDFYITLKIKTRFICCWVIFILSGLNFSFAQNNTTAKLEREIKTYEDLLNAQNQEVESINTALGTLNAQLEKRIRERDSLSAKLFGLREQQQSLQTELAEIVKEMQVNEDRLEFLSDDLQKLQFRLQNMLVHLHEQRVGRYARVLVESKSFFDLRVKSYYVSLLARQDVELIQSINKTVTAIERVQKELSFQVAKRNEAIVQLEQTQKDLEIAQDRLNKAIAGLEDSKEGKLAKRRALIREQKDLEQTIINSQQALAAEITRLEREVVVAKEKAEKVRQEAERQRLKEQAARAERKIETLNVPDQALESGFSSPMQSARLAVSYGQEGPYIYLKAPQAGATVLTAMSGVVTAVAQVSANSGYLVTVQHSKDLVTAYLNLQRPFVKVGDQVVQGQPLAYLGGGTLIPADNLQFRVGVPRSSGRIVWVDPTPKLGM